MKILVTGGAGFIGRHLVERLAATGCAVTVYDDLSTGRRNRLAPGVSLVTGDVRDAGAVRAAIAGCSADTVVHLAARLTDARTDFVASDEADVNVVGTLRVVEASVASGVRRFVFASSAGVYGEPSAVPTSEDQPENPRSPNGVAKYAAERLFAGVCGSSRLDVAVARFSNVYGPGQEPGDRAAVVASFVECESRGIRPTICGDGLQTRDFLFVRDAARAIEALLRSKAVGTFNVGTGIETSISRLRDCVSEAIGGPRPAPVVVPDRPFDVRRSCLDYSRLAAATGWNPEVALREGVRETVRAAVVHV